MDLWMKNSTRLDILETLRDRRRYIPLFSDLLQLGPWVNQPSRANSCSSRCSPALVSSPGKQKPPV
jgi:hypothetical protein